MITFYFSSGEGLNANILAQAITVRHEANRLPCRSLALFSLKVDFGGLRERGGGRERIFVVFILVFGLSACAQEKC